MIKKLLLDMITSIRHQIININGKYERNKHSKPNLLFFDNLINIEYFDSNVLKIDKKSYKNIDIYNIAYTTTKKLMIMKIYTV